MATNAGIGEAGDQPVSTKYRLDEYSAVPVAEETKVAASAAPEESKSGKASAVNVLSGQAAPMLIQTRQEPHIITTTLTEKSKPTAFSSIE